MYRASLRSSARSQRGPPFAPAWIASLAVAAVATAAQRDHMKIESHSWPGIRELVKIRRESREAIE